MGLTSNEVLVPAVLSAVLLFAGTVWLWPRPARRGRRAVGGRIAVLPATQIAVFASVGLVANQAFGFYDGWAGLSPYHKAPTDPTTGDLFQGNKRLQNEADLFRFLKHRPAPDTSLLVTSSKLGETDYRVTQKFIEQVKEKQPTRISSIVLDSGGHNFNTWRREIPATLQWISGRLSDR